MWNIKIFVVILVIYFEFLDQFSCNPVDYQVIGSKNLKNRQNLIDYEEYKFERSKFDDQVTYRLPNNTIPIRYDIIIASGIHEGNFNFSGNVKIHVRILEELTDRITLHYRQIDIQQVNLLNLDGSLFILDLTFEQISSHDFLVIYLLEYFDTGTEFIVDIIYKGQLRTDGYGFYRGSYKNSNNEEIFYAATQFQIDEARHAFPCYDEPGIRAEMSLTLIHGKIYQALSSMDIFEQIEDKDLMITKFSTTPKMQTYILAFMVSDFHYIEAGNSRVPQRIFGTPMAIENEEAEFAATVVGTILEEFEKILSIQYPLPKMDHAALTVFNSGGMENFGLINYISYALLLNPNLAGQAKFKQQNSITSLISHEFAHQWFGNIVSPMWWTYSWMNEGFAVLFENIVSNELFPERKFMNKFVTSIMPTAFKADGAGSWSMNHYTENSRELARKFDEIAYQKSSCVLRMIMDFMTIDVFIHGLRIYLTENYMTAVEPDNLHRSLQVAYDEVFPGNMVSIGDVMGAWENQAGYPLVSVSIHNNTIKLSQRRYPVSSGEIYPIPITFATKSNPNFITNSQGSVKTWLPTESFSYPQSMLEFIPGDWIILNVQQVGYYRVDYDTSLWKAIIRQLFMNNRKIHPINRAVLQDEIYIAWTTLDRVTAYDCLDMLSYFDMEDEPMVWNKAQSTLNLFYNRLFGTDVHLKFLMLVEVLTKAHLFRIGYENLEDEDDDVIQLRTLTSTWNCKALDRDCLMIDYRNFQKYRNENGTTNFDFCNAFRLVDEKTFAELLNNTIDDMGSKHRTQILSNMGCSLSSDNLDELLDAVANSENNLNMFERESILFNTFSKSGIGLMKSLDLISGSYMELYKLLPSFYDTARSLAKYINGEPRTSAFKQILDNLLTKNFITVQNYQTLLNTISSNNQWIDKNYVDVLRWFG